MLRLLKDGDLLTCCQLIKQRLDHHWIGFLEEKFFYPGFKHSKIHEHIFDLDVGIIVTPNFDRIYDNFATGKSSNSVRIKKYHEDDLARFIRSNERQRLILKIHGCIDSPSHLIFTRDDYASMRSRNANFYHIIEALVTTNTFIFIGCGGSDPDISLILENYARSFRDSPPNYFVTSHKWSNDYREMMKRNYNLVPLFYSGKSEHAELVESLAALGPQVELARDRLSDERLW
ncbi:SIR2 family NAD-dependent protein deacylase [Ancylobacter terrae]|uniref:SIR2 family NAD-dependent protein deacylase n=1 Tax=Ancylobacter sp. sgz301288 TaxID=3342077 RepID=UPI00385EE0CB